MSLPDPGEPGPRPWLRRHRFWTRPRPPAGDDGQAGRGRHVGLLRDGEPRSGVRNRAGIPTTGRSARLTINYRTTAEILAWALGMLRGEAIDDLDDGLDRIAGYRSPLHGPHPTLTGYRTRAAELAGLAEAIQAWLDQGVRPEEIGVAVRSNSLAEATGRALADADIPVRLLAQRNQPETAVAVGTMHRMKGLEFRCMAVTALNDYTIPAAITPEADDSLTHAQDLQRERCLLFVACTRAREDLRVSWYGTPSRFLDNSGPA